MTDNERVALGINLEHMVGTHGWDSVCDEMKSVQADIVRKIIKTPAEKCTGKAFQEMKAQYNSFEYILDWVEEKIREGKQAKEAMEKSGVR